MICRVIPWEFISRGDKEIFHFLGLPGLPGFNPHALHSRDMYGMDKPVRREASALEHPFFTNLTARWSAFMAFIKTFY